MTELDYTICQLRHAYMLLVNGYVKAENHKMFADGLIAPQIKRLEAMQCAEMNHDRARQDSERASRQA